MLRGEVLCPCHTDLSSSDVAEMPKSSHATACRDAINAIFVVIQNNTQSADISAVMSRIQQRYWSVAA